MLISSSLPVEQNVPVKPGKQEHKNAVVELLIHIPLFWHGALWQALITEQFILIFTQENYNFNLIIGLPNNIQHIFGGTLT